MFARSDPRNATLSQIGQASVRPATQHLPTMPLQIPATACQTNSKMHWVSAKIVQQIVLRVIRLERVLSAPPHSLFKDHSVLATHLRLMKHS